MPLNSLKWIIIYNGVNSIPDSSLICKTYYRRKVSLNDRNTDFD
ncbi:hypothetical protein DYBT9623_04452 [Dyadobacter sp. CECT 9623]|uniref:Uncharacterized protein n=1 Tax=Dyadobacter linearis TaxID=2823330 RepID=A0ABM8UW30_9BACT|nr:hypothetical protein DYBT9623_04452 [Dyadobacter sp. CECT 9623]